MKAACYAELLRQAGEELGATPVAYCSRKVTVRAMGLLRAAGQVQFDEVEKKVVGHRMTIDDYAENHSQICQEQLQLKQTIERQAQAVKRLESRKTSVRPGSGIDPALEIASVRPDSSKLIYDKFCSLVKKGDFDWEKT